MARCRPSGLGLFGSLASLLATYRSREMLVALASPASQIASSKTGSYFCTDPNRPFLTSPARSNCFLQIFPDSDDTFVFPGDPVSGFR